MSGFHLATVLRASLKFTNIDHRDPFLFPNLARLSLSLASRPELDLQIKLFGMLDLLTLPGLSLIKGLIIDFLCDFMGPRPDGTVGSYEILDGSWEDYQIQNIHDTRAGVTQPWNLWDFYCTDVYRREEEALHEHVHVLVVSLLFATDLASDAPCQCVARFGVGADADDNNDVITYKTFIRDSGAHNAWYEQHSFLVRTDTDILQVELVDAAGRRIAAWGEMFGVLRRKLFDYAPLGTKLYKCCDMGADLGTVHLLLQLLNPPPPPPPPAATAQELLAAAAQGNTIEAEGSDGKKTNDRGAHTAEDSEGEAAEGGNDVALKDVEDHWRAGGLVHIQLIKCLNLPSADDDSGRNDAFCVITGQLFIGVYVVSFLLV